jgi:hypothetical protein
MSELSETKAQLSGQPDVTPQYVDVEARRGHLSKISGGGVGTLIVWLSDKYNFTDNEKLLAGTAAAWAAVGVSWAGPSVADFVLYYGKYWRAKYFLNGLDRLAKSDPTDPVIAQKAREVRQLIADVLADGAKKSWEKVKRK